MPTFLSLDQVFKGGLPAVASRLQERVRQTIHMATKSNEQRRRYKRTKTPICWIAFLRKEYSELIEALYQQAENFRISDAMAGTESRMAGLNLPFAKMD